MDWKTLAILLNGSSLWSEVIVNSFDEILRCCVVIIRSKLEIHFVVIQLSILKKKGREFQCLTDLLQSPGEACVVHVGEGVRPAADHAPSGALHHAQALVVVPLIAAPDDGEQDDDDDLKSEEDDSTTDHAGLIKTICLVKMSVGDIL